MNIIVFSIFSIWMLLSIVCGQCNMMAIAALTTIQGSISKLNLVCTSMLSLDPHAPRCWGYNNRNNTQCSPQHTWIRVGHPDWLWANWINIKQMGGVENHNLIKNLWIPLSTRIDFCSGGIPEYSRRQKNGDIIHSVPPRWDESKTAVPHTQKWKRDRWRPTRRNMQSTILIVASMKMTPQEPKEAKRSITLPKWLQSRLITQDRLINCR